MKVEKYQKMMNALKKKSSESKLSKTYSKNSFPTPSGQCLRDVGLSLSHFFSGTTEGLDFVQDRLKCVICGTVPSTVYSTRRCEHKYCIKCVPMVEGKSCLICDVLVSKKEVDKFLTGLVYQTKKSKMLLALCLLNNYWRECAQVSSGARSGFETY